MYEMMFDLETLDTKPKAAVLSVGAVIWETMFYPENGELRYEVKDRFLRKLDLDEQFLLGRTVSQSTLLWWMQQDPTAKAEAFDPVRRGCEEVLDQLDHWVESNGSEITKFWASPDSFDFPIWEDLARDIYGAWDYTGYVPWKYSQKRDVRSVVDAANYSVRDHVDSTLVGVPHTPVYDCEWQISLLTAARNKINRRIGK